MRGEIVVKGLGRRVFYDTIFWNVVLGFNIGVLILVVVIVAAGLTTLFAQKNDVPISEDTKPSDNTNKDDTATKVELQPEEPASRGTTVNVDPSDKVELQQLFNDLRKEYLDTQAKYIDWWLEFIAIVLAFFAILIAIAGYIGFREFRRLRDEARQYVSEIQEDKAEADELIQNMRQRGNAEVFDMLSGSEEFEESLRDLLQNSELSVMDKAIADASALQRDGAIKDAIEKWRSIANIVEETDSDLAARSWFSVGYLHSQEGEPEEAIPAYDKAISLKPDYAEAYNNRGASNGKLGQYDAAIADLDNAIVLDRNDAEAYYNRGCIKFLIGARSDASANFDESIHFENAKSDFQTALDLAIQQGRTELKTDIEERLHELNNVE